MLLVCTGAAPLFREPYGGELSDEAWYGQGAEILEDCGEFLKVRLDYGYEGFIRRRALAKWEYRGEVCRVCSPFADVMEAPSYRAGRLLTLPRGAAVEAGPREGNWREVGLIGGGRGYLRRTHLKEAARRSPPYGQGLRKSIADTALSYLGAPYRWGGRTPAGIDCSGLCHAAYLINGVAIFRDSRMKEGYPVRGIPRDALALSDLIYFPGHVALYLGEGRYVHATGRAGDDRVRINSLEEGAPDYREDLAKGLLCCGSIF